MNNQDNKNDVPDNVFDELMAFGKQEEKKQQNNLSKNSGNDSTTRYRTDNSARNNFLKQASEFDQKSAAARSDHTGSDIDQNERYMETSAPVQIKPQGKKEEPLGHIENVQGIPKCVLGDDYLQPATKELLNRQDEFKKWLDIFQGAEGGLENISRSYKKFGLNLQPNNDITFMEWAPEAVSMSIFGEFNNWNRDEFRAQRNEYGCFCITLRAKEDGSPRVQHRQKYKIQIEQQDGKKMDRNSAWAKWLVQENNNLYDCVFWNPPVYQQFKWEHIDPVPTEGSDSVRIYESHVGMAQEGGQIGSYGQYVDHILPRIKEAGYNVIQLMAIQEHAYYGSFGYHVTGFFGVSSRSGTPDEFKYLVDRAHSMGLKVIIDLVHSHASNNVMDGINKFDGSDHCYSHAGERGYHSAWDSMVFDYSKYEVKRFLLSNLAWWLDEYHVDGFRFDAVTSILYHHHGIGKSFSGNLNEYFGTDNDVDGIVYLMLANTLIKKIRPDAITIAEDVSGMPTLCRAIRDGGIGFDYRLSMFLPDMWINLLKNIPDEEWSMNEITRCMTDRREAEKTVAYSESHDQAIVGDQTQAMWLFGQEIYQFDRRQQPSLKVSRGIALHKMIRLITFSLGGNAYLNFMGNEFGHPEWIDFPREGNNFSYHMCRRQWNLKYNQDLRFGQLGEFDRVMNYWETVFGSLHKSHLWVSSSDETDRLIIYEKGELVYIMNFHTSKSYEHYTVGTNWKSDHMILYETDEERFSGHQRLNDGKNKWYKVADTPHMARKYSLKLYIPSRCAIVLAPFEFARKYNQVTLPHYDSQDPAFRDVIEGQQNQGQQKVVLPPMVDEEVPEDPLNTSDIINKDLLKMMGHNNNK